MPDRYRPPHEMEEVLIIDSLGYPTRSGFVDQWPEHLVEKMIILKGVKNVVQFGGNWQP